VVREAQCFPHHFFVSAQENGMNSIAFWQVETLPFAVAIELNNSASGVQ
jgi:hypothetical protein